MMRINSERSAPLFHTWFGLPMLLLVAVLIALASSIIVIMLGTRGTALAVVAIIVAGLVILLVVRHQLEWVAGIIIVVSVLIDWHHLIPIRFPIYATAIALVPIAAALLARLYHRSWVLPPRWWLCAILLILGALPVLWAVKIPEAIIYYLSTIFTPVLLFIIGMMIGRESAGVRRLLNILSGFGTLIAVHTIIAALTGIFLLITPDINDYLLSVNDFALGSSANRVGSFFRNPDWTGAFLAMMVFVTIGLLAAAPSRLAKFIYLVETIMILLALLFTYTAASWLALVVGFIPLFLLVGRGARRMWFPVLVFAAIAGIYYAFPAQSAAFFQHLENPNDAHLRLGAWQTAIRVIIAYPFRGVGLGPSSYLLRAEPYRVPLQYRSLAHPHNSYLELGALAGLPVLLVFLALLGTALWQALQNHRGADERSRSLLGGALVAIVVFSINCVAINGWTLPPLAAIAWLILGAISSPMLEQSMSPGASKWSSRAGAGTDHHGTNLVDKSDTVISGSA